MVLARLIKELVLIHLGQGVSYFPACFPFAFDSKEHRSISLSFQFQPWVLLCYRGFILGVYQEYIDLE